jgi:hypothetical protein
MSYRHNQVTLVAGSEYLDRQDPIKHTNFQVGDMVIVCSKAGEAFALESLAASDNKCPFCGETIVIAIETQTTQTHVGQDEKKSISTKVAKEKYQSDRHTNLTPLNLTLISGAILLVICFFVALAYALIHPGPNPAPPPATSTALPIFSTPSLEVPSTSSSATPVELTPLATATSGSISKIVFTCQIFKDPHHNQICLMNSDGSDWRRLTNDNYSDSYYASLAPDGQSIVYASGTSSSHQIFEMDLLGNSTQLTFGFGDADAPEISPDGRSIVFTNNTDVFSQIWIMNRDGGNPHVLYNDSSNELDAKDPTWSPDGKQILFAVGNGNKRQLFVMNADGSNPKLLNKSFLQRVVVVGHLTEN